jgi:hypothetical protein
MYVQMTSASVHLRIQTGVGLEPEKVGNLDDNVQRVRVRVSHTLQPLEIPGPQRPGLTSGQAPLVQARLSVYFQLQLPGRTTLVPHTKRVARKPKNWAVESDG